MQNKVTELKAQNKTKEEIQQAVKEDLKTNEEIVKAEVSDSGESIWFTFKSGVLGAISLEGDSPSPKLLSQSFYGAAQGSLSNTQTKMSVGNPLVAIFTSHGNTNDTVLNETLSNTDFLTKTFKDEKATVEEFKKLSEYGTIIFDTKGESLFKGNLKQDLKYLDEIFSDEAEKVVILTGEKASEASIEKYNGDLKTGRLVIVDDYFAITSAFVKHYTKGQDKSMPNSFVYANTNKSMHNQTMAKAFTENGAQTYVGYTGAKQESELKQVIENMLNDKSVGSSVNTATVFGNNALVLATSPEIINGSLEEGLNGWIGKGHIDTISRLGSGNHPSWNTIKPTDKNNMGIISSGVDKGALYGRQSWIYQTFTVPEDATNLKFDYNVASSEPMEFIGSQYDDKFKATIVEGKVKEPSQEEGYEEEMPINLSAAKSTTSRRTESKMKLSSMGPEDEWKGNNDWVENTVDEGEVIIGFESINSSDWGQDFSDDRKRLDVVFPEGDETTYMTGWKTVNYDITKYQGKTITLKLQTWDLGDTAYPTAVLFDNLRLTKANYSGVGIEGRTEIQIPSKGVNEYLYEAGRIDQDGDIQTGKITTYEDEHGFVKPKREFTAKVKMTETVEGVSLDETTGILSVSTAAQVGEITLTAYDANGNEKNITVKLNEAKPSVPKSILVDGISFIDTADIEEGSTKKYMATIRDQYGDELEEEYNVKWSIAEQTVGVTIDATTGELSIDPSLLENENTNITIKAYLEEFDITGYIEVTIYNSNQAVEMELLATAKSELQAQINGAQELHNQAVEGAEPGNYAGDSKATLQAAITTAQQAHDATDATVESINAADTGAKAVLQAAVEAFEKALIKTEVTDK